MGSINSNRNGILEQEWKKQRKESTVVFKI
jgi:hypothetical protein